MGWGWDNFEEESEGEGVLIRSSKKALIRLGGAAEREGTKTEDGRPRDAATGARTCKVI
jgi:hypothetical protein